MSSIFIVSRIKASEEYIRKISMTESFYYNNAHKQFSSFQEALRYIEYALQPAQNKEKKYISIVEFEYIDYTFKPIRFFTEQDINKYILIR